MYINLYELFYIIFTSSTLHLIIVISIIYLIYTLVLVKKNNDAIAEETVDQVNIFLNVLYSNLEKNKEISPYLTKSNIKQILYNLMPPTSENDKVKEQQINEINKKENKPYINKLKIFFIIVASIFTGLFILLNIVFYKKLSYKYLIIELIASLLLAFGLLALYEYLFAYLFIFNYTNYHIYNFVKNRIFYSDNVSVYNYNNQ
jgi:hypothetical protein